MDLKEEIIQHRNKYGSVSSVSIKRYSPELFEKIIMATSRYKGTVNDQSRIYYILNDIQPGKCKVCNKETKFHHKVSMIYCSHACSTKDNLNSSSGREHYKKVMLEKYGVDNAFKYKEIMKDVINPMKREDCKTKLKETNRERYGTTVAINSEKYKKEIRENNLIKYGVDHPMKSKEVKERVRTTFMERYGVGCAMHMQYVDYLDRQTDILELYDKTGDLLKVCETYNLDINFAKGLLKFFGVVFDITSRNTLIEDYFKKILLSKNIEFESNKRILDFHDGKMLKEIDIFIPEKKFGIEINGLYWHTEKNKMKSYHLSKTEAAKEKDITLFHFWDVEFNEKTHIVMSMVNNKLGINEKIFARKCEIRFIDHKETKDFLLKNHLQGPCVSSYNIGLYYENELVSLMTFGKSRYNKNYDWELLRFCNKLNTTVVGGASKLLKYFTQNCGGSLISYANRRYSDGNLYEALGFEESHRTPPNYFYFNTKKPNGLESRLKFQKHKLKTLLPVFDPEKTEYENMLMNGYDRVWDCGQIVYVMNG